MTNQIAKRSLPLLPHPEHLRKEAKARLASSKAERPGTRLTDAQRSLAQEYGYPSWAALQAEVERRANGPLGRRVHLRKSFAAFQLRENRATADQGSRTPHAAGTARPALLPPELDDHCPQAFLRVGVIAQVGFFIVALLGVGMLCFALHRAGMLLQPGPHPRPIRIVLTETRI
jgi:hypothetical protein